MAFTGKKREKKQPPAQQRGSDKGSDSKGKAERRPWFKPEHLPPTNGIEMDVQIGGEVRLYTGGDFGPQLIVHVTTEDDKEFDWSIKIGGQQFIRLEKVLGKNLLYWPDKIVAVTGDEYEGRRYIAVVENQQARN